MLLDYYLLVEYANPARPLCSHELLVLLKHAIILSVETRQKHNDIHTPSAATDCDLRSMEDLNGAPHSI